MEFFHSLLDLFSHLQPVHYLLLVFAAYIVENIFPPLPGDTMLVFTAYVFGLNHDRGDFVWLYGASVAGAIVGFMLMVSLGRYLGRQFFLEKNYKYASGDFLCRVERYFDRYGKGVILWNRLFFGLRPVIGLVSGMSGLRWYRILGLVSISAVLFNAAFILLGYVLGENWSLIESILEKYTVITVSAALLLIVLFIRKWVRRKKKTPPS